MSGNPEQLQNEKNRDIEVSQSESSQLEKLSNNFEAYVELSPRDTEAQAEKARKEVLETAKSIKTGEKEAKKSEQHPVSSRRGLINDSQLDESYKRTMKHVQDELPASSRIYSNIIHNKVIEKMSDIVGNTIARPNAILLGAVVAFVLTLLTYTVAKTIGYALSGFETIGAFIIGWLIGIIYDYLRVLITGTKS
jgi:hypothetical protein